MTEPLEAYYGLPTEVKFCTGCVISNQRPNSAREYQHTAGSKKPTIRFDAEGVCDACRVAEAKKQIDWDAREKELRALCDKYRRNDGHYDCLVPGSGGKDSFYQSHMLKYKYGMHPLTVTWAPNLYTDVGRHNHQKWIDSGLDNYLMTPNSRVHRLLTRLSVDNLFHPFQPFMLGQKFLGPRMAAKFGIPLVFYGENEAEYGNPVADIATSLRDDGYHSSKEGEEINLGGVNTSTLCGPYGLDMADLQVYLPPRRAEVKDVQVRYLGYYLKWKPQDCYFYAVEHGGFKANPLGRSAGTYSKYNSLDDKIDDLHYYCTYVKFGIGRATYDASQEVRSGDITREEGVALIQRFDGEFPDRFIPELMEHLSITEREHGKAFYQFASPTMTVDGFMHRADHFRSPHLWDGRELRHRIWVEAPGTWKPMDAA